VGKRVIHCSDITLKPLVNVDSTIIHVIQKLHPIAARDYVFRNECFDVLLCFLGGMQNFDYFALRWIVITRRHKIDHWRLEKITELNPYLLKFSFRPKNELEKLIYGECYV